MTIEEYLKDVKARAEAATEGPWRKRKNNTTCSVYPRVGNMVCSALDYSKDKVHSDCNMDFIAHSRTDIPRLLRIAEAAMTQKRLHDEWEEACDCPICVEAAELEKTLATDPPKE